MRASAVIYQSIGREPCDRSGIEEALCSFVSCLWACAHSSDRACRLRTLLHDRPNLSHILRARPYRNPLFICSVSAHNATMQMERRQPRTDGSVDVAQPRGAVFVMTGCMFSGKTTRLLDRLAELPPHVVQVFKHAIDRRCGGATIATHSGRTHQATAIRSSADLAPLLHSGTMAVAIDEAHFFDDGLPEMIDLVAWRGVDVLVTALDRDSWGRPFPLMQRIMAGADSAVVLKAVCSTCTNEAVRTQRVTPIVDGQMIGGADHYEPRCVACWTAPPEDPPA